MTGAMLITDSGQLTRPVRSRGRHRKQAARRFTSNGNLSVGLASVLLAGLVFISGLLVKWATEHAVAPPPAPPPVAGPTTPSPARPVVEPPGAAAPPYPVDAQGFVNSTARCDGPETAVAIGRTQGSLVVICADPDGRYGYLGVRLSDDAVLKTSAHATPTHEFVAQNASVRYAVSPVELKITAGGSVIKQETMIEYREAAAR
jgi:hypothetical protein